MKKIVWLAFVIVFVLPSVLYFVGNGYLWLFGTHPVAQDKMAASFCVAFFGIWTAAVWNDERKVWK